MKKELFIPVLILGLTVAFAVLSLLVFLNGGRSAKLIRRKIMIITALLNFNNYIWGMPQVQNDLENPLYGVKPPLAPIHLGLNIAYNSHKADNMKLSYFSDESVANASFSGAGYSAGCFLQFFMGPKYEHKHSIKLNFNYNWVNLTRNTQIVQISKYVDTSGLSSEPAGLLTGSVSNTYVSFDFELIYSYKAIGNFSCFAGTAFRFISVNNITEKVSINESAKGELRFRNDLNPARYENDYTAILTDGKPENAAHSNFGFIFGVSYDIITGTGFDIIPYLGGSIAITDLVPGTNWKMNTIYAGLSIRYTFLF